MAASPDAKIATWSLCPQEIRDFQSYGLEWLMHHENCQCLACMTWFVLMSQFLGRGRCKCGAPIDDHRMSSKGELQACPQPTHA